MSLGLILAARDARLLSGDYQRLVLGRGGRAAGSAPRSGCWSIAQADWYLLLCTKDTAPMAVEVDIELYGNMQGSGWQ